MAKFKWANAHEWLADRIQKLQGQHNVEELAGDLRSLADQIDEDTLQDVFQPDMDADGYFQNQTECSIPTCTNDTDVVGRCEDCDSCLRCCGCNNSVDQSEDRAGQENGHAFA